MKRIERRDKLKIYGDLLSALNSDASTKKIMLSHVQMKANVPFDRLKIYIAELVDLGLIEDDTSLKITDKGKQYLREYEKVLIFMEAMGISYRSSR
jgi:predicted transcriptional regulator